MQLSNPLQPVIDIITRRLSKLEAQQTEEKARAAECNKINMGLEQTVKNAKIVYKQARDAYDQRQREFKVAAKNNLNEETAAIGKEINDLLGPKLRSAESEMKAAVDNHETAMESCIVINDTGDKMAVADKLKEILQVLQDKQI